MVVLWVVDCGMSARSVRSQWKEHLRIGGWLDDVGLIELFINLEDDVHRLLRQFRRLYIGGTNLERR